MDRFWLFEWARLSLNVRTNRGFQDSEIRGRRSVLMDGRKQIDALQMLEIS